MHSMIGSPPDAQINGNEAVYLKNDPSETWLTLSFKVAISLLPIDAFYFLSKVLSGLSAIIFKIVI